MIKSLRLTLLLAVIATVALSGRIYPWGEPVFTYPNTGQITTADLFFSLESPLPAGHVLRVTFPFGSSPSISSFAVYTMSGTAIASATAPNLLQVSGAAPFHNYLRFATALAASTNYRLRITFGTSPADATGFLGYIQVETLSPATSVTTSLSATDTPITYDLNNAFAPFHMLPAPGTPNFVIQTVTQSNTSNSSAAATYQLLMRITPSRDFWYWPTIEINWDNSLFAMSGCASIDTGAVVGTQTPLAASLFTCSVNSPSSSTIQKGSILIQQNTLLPKNQTAIWSINVQNPSVSATTSLSVKIYHRYNLNLSDISTTNTSQTLTTSVTATSVSCSVTNYKMLLAWGIDRAASNNQALLKVFRLHQSNQNQPAFQSVTFSFNTSVSLATSNYTIVIQICNTITIAGPATYIPCGVIENSITLSSALSAATCSVQTTGPIQIICANITTLGATNTIGARIWLSDPAVAGTSAFFTPSVTGAYFGAVGDTTFGQISIKSPKLVGNTWGYGTDPCTGASLPATYTASFIDSALAVGNLRYVLDGALNAPAGLSLGALVATDQSNWASYKAVTAYSIAAAAVALNPSSGGGIFGSTTAGATNLALNLNHDLQNLDFLQNGGLTAATPSNLFGTGASQVQTNAGIDFFLNPNLYSVNAGYNPQNCYAGQATNAVATTAATLSGNIAVASLHCTSVAVTTASFNYVRVRAINTAASAAFGLTPLGAAGANQIIFFWEQFVTMSPYAGASLKADSSCGEYYAATYWLSNNVAALTPAPAQPTGTTAATITDVGELGATTTTAVDGIIQIIHFNQPIYSPLYVTGTNPPTVASSLSIWATGWHLAAAAAPAQTPLKSAANQIGQLRLTGKIGSEISPGAGAALCLFYQPHLTPTITSLLPVGPAQNSPYSTGTARCVSSGQVGRCYVDAKGKNTNPGNIVYPNNFLDLAEVYRTNVPFSSTNFSVTFFVNPVLAVPGGLMTYTWSFVNSNGMHYIYNIPVTSTAVQANTVLVNQPCGIQTNNGIQLYPTATDYVNSTSASINLKVQFTTAGALAAASTNQASWVWCMGYPFANTSFSWTNTWRYDNATTGDKCSYFDYNYVDTSVTPNVNYNWYCFYCPIYSSIPSGDNVTLLNFQTTPSSDILYPSFSQITFSAGMPLERGWCTGSVNQFQPANATITTLPGNGYGLSSQKVIFTLVTTNTLKTVNVITLTGQYANLTRDLNFPYGTLDSSTACYLVPAIYASQTSSYISCTAKAYSGLIVISNWTWPTSANTTYQSQLAWQIILWGYNPNPVSSLNPTTLYYIATTQVGPSGSLLDRTSTASGSLATWTLTSNVTNPLFVWNPQYQRPHLGARGWFRWDFSFPPQRNLFWNDQIVFNLDSLITYQTNNVSGVLRCRVTDQNDVILQKFRSCTINMATTLPTVTIVPDAFPNVLDFAVPRSVRIYLDNVQTGPLQTIQTVYGQVKFGNTIALARLNTSTDNLIPALTNVSGLAVTPNITYNYKHYSSFHDIQFNITLTTPLNETNRLAIVFPSYYNPGLDTRGLTPFCTIEGSPAFCYPATNQPRTINIEGTTVARAQNVAFKVKISGIAAPAGNYTPENFWIQVNNDTSDNPLTVANAGTVIDTVLLLPNTSIKPIHVNWHTLSSTSTRSTASFVWVFNSGDNSTFAPGTSAVRVVFPDSWNVAIGYGNVQCKLFDWIATTVFSAQAGTTGNQVVLNLTSTIPSWGVVALQCDGVRTPEMELAVFPSQDISIMIVDVATSNITYESAPNVHNVNHTLRFSSSAYSYIEWTTNTFPLLNNLSQVTVSRGTYSAPLTLNFQGRASRSFSIAPTNQNFGFWPNPFNISFGLPTYTASLGCASNVAIGYYAVSFTITDSSTYTPPGSLIVLVTKNSSVISVNPPLPSTVSALYSNNGTSRTAPVVFDTSMNLPFSDVTITPVISGTGSANFTVSPASITLTPSAPKQAFVFTTTFTTNPNATATVTYVLSGSNAAAYNVSGIHVVQLMPDLKNQASVKPALSLTFDVNDQNLPTTRLIDFSVSGVDTATIYYVVGLAGSINYDAQTLMYLAAQYPAFNASSPNQQQFGVFSQAMSPSMSPQYMAVSGLIPNTAYEIRAIASSLTNQNSSVAYLTFTTANNGFTAQRWQFNMDQYPSSTQRQAILCAVSQLLAVPAYKVWSFNNDYCGFTNQTSIYFNTTGTIGIYFYPLAYDVEPTMSNLVQTFNSTTFLNSLNGSLTSAGFLTSNYSYESTVASTAPTFSIPAPQMGNTWIALSNMSLSANGVVYILLDRGSSLAPNATSLKAIQSGNTTSPQQTRMFYYNAQLGNVFVNFSNLQNNTAYNIYIVASNDDPSYNAQFGPVAAIQLKTTQPTIVIAANAAQLGIALLLAIASIMLIL